ncbi:hypothetical protein ACIGW3_26020 [Streptomyces sp. NPDC053499]|uniref:hypothetical protein n=1 Tax=Streptomyces sp. NPDC053499 TaxID=3365707 RepID=UPI0037D5070E
MSTSITPAPPDIIPTTIDARRRGLQAAHSVAASVIALSPIAPMGVTASCPPYDPNEPHVEIYFYDGGAGAYQAAAGVAALAAALGFPVTRRRHSGSDARAYVSAEGMHAGVRVHVWTLLAEVVATDV